MDLISVIVPVYKVEKYLDKCIESIVNQTYSNLEIILVDDGSPDRCGEICDEWAKKDSRIRVIHQENCGAGNARNTGIRYANGNIFAFIDSDDYLANQMFERLYNILSESVDIVECDYIITTYDDAFDRKVSDDKNYIEYDVIDAMKEHIADHVFRQVIWNKLYRRETIEGVEFPTGKKIDDEYWTYRVIGNANRLRRIETELYAYRQQDTSVMHLLSLKQQLQGLDAKCKRHLYIQQKFPMLISESTCNIWSACMYQGQIAIQKNIALEERKIAQKYVKTIIDQFPIRRIHYKELPIKQRMWFSMARISFSATCKIRNHLGIGK